jgi:hypothetical protein
MKRAETAAMGRKRADKAAWNVCTAIAASSLSIRICVCFGWKTRQTTSGNVNPMQMNTNANAKSRASKVCGDGVGRVGGGGGVRPEVRRFGLRLFMSMQASARQKRVCERERGRIAKMQLAGKNEERKLLARQQRWKKSGPEVPDGGFTAKSRYSNESSFKCKSCESKQEGTGDRKSWRKTICVGSEINNEKVM